MRSGQHPKTAVLNISIVQRGQCRDRRCGIKMTVAIVLMPAKWLGVAPQLERQLRRCPLDVRADQLLRHANKWAVKVIVTNQAGSVVNIRQQRVLQPGCLRVELPLLRKPSAHALGRQLGQALATQRTFQNEKTVPGKALALFLRNRHRIARTVGVCVTGSR